MLLLVSAALTFHTAAVTSGATYRATGKISADQGTVSFWWKARDGVVFQVTPTYPVTPGDVCLRITHTRGIVQLSMRDRNARAVFFEAVRTGAEADRPIHLAVTWSELSGAALYVDGKRRAAVPGPLYLRSGVDAFAFPSGDAEELRVYSGPLDIAGVEQLARRQDPVLPEVNPPPAEAGRYGWHAAANIPHGSRFRVRKIAVDDARAVNRFWWKLVDGRRDTMWPAPSADWAYPGERTDYQITPVAEPFNVVRSTGDAEAVIEMGDEIKGARPAGQELHYVNIRNPLLVDDVTVNVHNGILAEVECLRVEPLPEGEMPRGVLRLPVAREAAVRGVRVELDSVPGRYYYFAVLDPDDESRKIIEFDARANASRLVVELEFMPYVLRIGQTMKIETSSPTREVRWLGADVEASRKAHLARRRLELRDLAQSRPELAPLAEWKEPPPPDGVPRWAWQQVKLVARARQLADWWIDFRQIATGQFGNGAAADADLARLLPVVARLDGKVERYRQSTRLLLRSNPAAVWSAYELDAGNPELAEQAMELQRAGIPFERRDVTVSDVEKYQSDMWQWLEQRFEWLTTGEPQRVAVDLAPLEAIRLGPRRDVSWENTGGEIAAVVDEAREDGVRVRVFSLSSFGRRIRMGAWSLAHGEYDLSVAGEAPRRVTVKPPAYFEVDLPSRRVTAVELKLRERRTPVSEMPDLAVVSREIEGSERGLSIPVHNLGKAAAGPFRVTVKWPDDRVVAEAAYAGLEAPRDLRPRILLARFAELQATPGLRIEVRLESGEDALDSNNRAEVKPRPAPGE
jgi:hypothetical protein